ncbi:hypothetical protein AM587_10000517 [Phytophthora nicotianae]|uniref:Uncharacterized protein n=1 Tax=Phytophthora nicotianae TaxID=4792 RepID=A0A0W8CI78_PHYNI|nr:hypothetical protein AM587_10000312 [Phytophthora nicotianae]KUF83830.1 hypothetical protein AM587_10000517 [Phytophthora nicotianae]
MPASTTGRSEGPPSSISLSSSSGDSEDFSGTITPHRRRVTARVRQRSTDSEEKAAEETLGDLNTSSSCVSGGDDDYEYASDSEDSSDSDVYNHEHDTASTQEQN